MGPLPTSEHPGPALDTTCWRRATGVLARSGARAVVVHVAGIGPLRLTGPAAGVWGALATPAPAGDVVRAVRGGTDPVDAAEVLRTLDELVHAGVIEAAC